MATDVMMPRLSDSMEEGTVLKWLVDEGAEVKRGDALAEIETDKANMTYEADQEGTLVEIVAGEGDTVAIGEVIARLGEAGEAKSGDDGGAEADEEEETEASTDTEDSQSAEEEEEADEDEEEAEPEPEPAAAKGNGDGGGRVKASPVARRMAEELGVDLSELEGSGPGGRIVKADVEAAAGDGDGSAPEAEPAEEEAPEASEEAEEPSREPAPAAEAGAKGEVETVELSRLQKTVSRRMAESKATAPDFQLTVEVEMEGCIALREQLRAFTEKPPSFNDMVVKACAMALRDFPRANGSYRDGAFELYSRVNVGIAVAAQDALVVPTIFDADKKSLGEISRDARGLAQKVRDGDISPPELSGGTFTVSNLGMYGIDEFIAVINPPQAGILAVGAMKPKPVVDEDGRIVARNLMTIRLSTDHRILYGADAAEFLARIRELLEQPLGMAI
jgi:pyruvate dehydrogenase E2 component (dihydrolipoamide acetyltransferase)